MHNLTKLKKQGFKAVAALMKRAERVIVAENYRFGGQDGKGVNLLPTVKIRRVADSPEITVKKSVDFRGNFGLYSAFVERGEQDIVRGR